MGAAALREPEILIESLGVGDQRVFVPFRDSPAEIQRIVSISAKLALLGTPVRINDPVGAISTAHELENAFAVPVFDKLHPVRALELTRAARGDAKQISGIVLQQVALAQFVQIAGPALKRRHLVDVPDVAQKPVGIHRDFGFVLDKRAGARLSPVACLPGWWSKPGLPVGPPRNLASRLVARRRCQWASAGTEDLLPSSGHDDRPGPSLAVSVSGRNALNGDRVSRLERIAVPSTSLKIDGAFELDRPVDRRRGA